MQKRRTLSLGIATLVSGVLLAEVAVRGLIKLRFRPLMNALYYFPLTTDEHWIFMAQHALDKVPPPPVEGQNPSLTQLVFHPVLGWSYARTEHNPLGIRIEQPMGQLTKNDRPLLFFGDSFMEGTGKEAESIPALVGAGLKKTALNYAVSGYGLDQIYIRLRDTVPRFRSEGAVTGILLDDLDRCILSIRGGLKPYFTVEKGQLKLQVDHLAKGRQSYVHAYPLGFALYSLRLIKTFFPRFAWETDPSERIKTVSSALVRELNKQTSALPKSLAVIFYELPRLNYVDWRESFLKETLEREGMKYLDTKPLLLGRAKELNVPVGDFYSVNRHPNAKGNGIVAEEIVRLLGS